MDEDTIEELRELGMQLLITSLISMSTVLVNAAINKLKHGHITNVPSRNYHRRSESIYDDDDDPYGSDDYYINLED